MLDVAAGGLPPKRAFLRLELEGESKEGSPFAFPVDPSEHTTLKLASLYLNTCPMTENWRIKKNREKNSFAPISSGSKSRVRLNLRNCGYF